MRRFKEGPRPLGRREMLLRQLEQVAQSQGTREITPEEFLDHILSAPGILGAPIPKDKAEIKNYLKNLLKAMLAGEETFEEFTRRVTAGITDREFEKTIVTTSPLTFGDLFLLTLRASDIFTFKNGNKNDTSIELKPAA